MRPRHGILFATGLSLVLLTGCGQSGPKTAPVTGTVTFNGEPLHTGTVTFIPDTGPYASGQIQEDGTYRLETFRPRDGAILGHHRIMVNAVEIPDAMFPEAVAIIPGIYGSEQTSGLDADVKDEKNIVDLALVGEDPRAIKPKKD